MFIFKKIISFISNKLFNLYSDKIASGFNGLSNQNIRMFIIIPLNLLVFSIILTFFTLFYSLTSMIILYITSLSFWIVRLALIHKIKSNFFSKFLASKATNFSMTFITMLLPIYLGNFLSITYSNPYYIIVTPTLIVFTLLIILVPLLCKMPFDYPISTYVSNKLDIPRKIVFLCILTIFSISFIITFSSLLLAVMLCKLIFFIILISSIIIFIGFVAILRQINLYLIKELRN